MIQFFLPLSQSKQQRAYVQNLGCIASTADTNIPPKIKDILLTFSSFLEKIVVLIPNVPQIDIRSQLILEAIALPMILDILFEWFLMPFITALIHTIDLISMFFLAYFGFSFYEGGRNVLSIIIVAVTGVYILGRLIYLFFIKKKQKMIDMLHLGIEVCHHYLDGIIKTKEGQKTLTFAELNEQISKFSSVIEITDDSSVRIVTKLPTFFISLICIFVGLVGLGLIPSVPNFLPINLRAFLPYVLLGLGGILFITFSLRLFKCGRNLIIKFKILCKRYGLRILMLILDILYIPILTIFVSHVFPTKNHKCPVGYYREFNVSVPQSYAMFKDFIQHNTSCVPCSTI